MTPIDRAIEHMRQGVSSLVEVVAAMESRLARLEAIEELSKPMTLAEIEAELANAIPSPLTKEQIDTIVKHVVAQSKPTDEIPNCTETEGRTYILKDDGGKAFRALSNLEALIAEDIEAEIEAMTPEQVHQQCVESGFDTDEVMRRTKEALAKAKEKKP